MRAVAARAYCDLDLAWRQLDPTVIPRSQFHADVPTAGDPDAVTRRNQATSARQTARAAGSRSRPGDGRDRVGQNSSTNVQGGRVTLPAEVRAAAAALGQARFDYLFLRGWDVLGADEIDMLVDQGTFDRLSEILRPIGFAELLGPGRGSHRFLVRYDVPENRWTKLDVVTEVAFGSRQELLACEARPVLRRADIEDGVRIIAAGDRFWATLLHRVADPSEQRRGAELDDVDLLRLGATADPLSPIAEPFLSPTRRNRVHGGVSAARAIEAALRGDADELARLGRSAVSATRRRRARDVASRVMRHDIRHIARRIQSSIGFPARRGLVVVLLGPDGAGKSQLAASMTASTPLPVRSRYMGLYQLRRHPRRRGLSGLARLTTVVATSIRTRLDRRRGRLVVLDRHVYDLLERPGSRRSRLRRAIYLRAGITPDLVILLDAPAQVLHQRRPEQSLDAAESERQRYLRIAGALPEAIVVDAERPASEVLARVNAIIWDGLTARHRSAAAAVGRNDHARP